MNRRADLALLVLGLVGLVLVVLAGSAPRPAVTVIPTATPLVSGNPSRPTEPPMTPVVPVPTGQPSARPVPSAGTGVGVHGSGGLVLVGMAGYALPSFGSGYLAIPQGPGHHVRVCLVAVPDRCLERTSTDAGPSLARQRQGRVADLSFRDFGSLCRCNPAIPGLLRVRLEVTP